MTIPPFDFNSFVSYKDMTGETHCGIEWGVREIFDIFSPLSGVADVALVNVFSLFFEICG